MSTPDVADIFYVVHGDLVQRTQFAVDIRAERLELKVVVPTTMLNQNTEYTHSQVGYLLFSDSNHQNSR